MVEKAIEADTAENLAWNTELAKIIPPPCIELGGIRRGLILLEPCVGDAGTIGDLRLDDGGISESHYNRSVLKVACSSKVIHSESLISPPGNCEQI